VPNRGGYSREGIKKETVIQRWAPPPFGYITSTVITAPEVVIRRYYTCFNERRVDEAAELFAEDAALEQLPFQQTERGGSGYVRFAKTWLSAFPDGRLTVERIEPRGDTIFEVSLVGTGTHLGTLDLGAMGTFRPTQVVATLPFRELLEIRAGKITFASLSFDVHELLRQLVPVNVTELKSRLNRIRELSGELTEAGDDVTGQQYVIQRLGAELDEARRVVRPHLNRRKAR
jgi:hypothetical protein